MTIRFLLYLILALSLRIATAHTPFEITTNAHIFADHISINVLISDSTAARLCLTGTNARSKLHEKEFATEHSRIERCAAELYLVKDGGATLAPRSVQMHLTDEKDLDATITYPAGIGSTLRFEAVHLKLLKEPGYVAVFTATRKHTVLAQKLLLADDPVLDVSLDSKPQGAQAGTRFLEFLGLGTENVLAACDSLLLLAGLLLVCCSWRPALLIITSFTLGHSLTLELAGLGIANVPSHIVAPFMAATIVYVGIENLWRGRGTQESGEPRGAFQRRWIIAFAFGLMHGFGFAGALQKIDLPSEPGALLPRLFGFNLGIEIGQMAVVAALLPLLFWLRRWPQFVRHGVPAISIVMIAAGGWWFVQRTALQAM
jgi:hypothetical protein